jgi:tetratricopeptide (TPR) repeat protein
VKKRHETLLKAFGCFEQYKHTRLSVTKYSISKDGSPIPGSVIPDIPSRFSNSISSISSTPSSCTLLDNGSSGGALSVDNEMGIDSTETQNKTEGKEKEREKEEEKEKKEKVLNTIEMETDYDYNLDTSCVKNHHRSAPHADPELQSENISDEALLQEVHFNYGRAYSELKFYHLAVKHFNLALALADSHPFLRGNKYHTNRQINNNESSSNSNIEMSKNDNNRCYIKQNSKDLNSSCYYSHLQVTRECAHNLVLIYKKSGAIDQALEVMKKYLTF